ncbi:sensor histidine kinase [Sphingomonas adhaesiva]|uniref:sensor histidine kinase n=1 Tax=Sphingomonas adhaesiva TaxID=28212 RepID=UPI002FF7B27B
MSEVVILTAGLGADDRLREADAAFAAINDRAGGRVGAPVAVPQFATLGRLARRLGIPIARAVTIADGDIDLDCWVKAAPRDGGVALAVSLVRERPAWRAPVAATTIAEVPPPPGADWTWAVDAELRVTQVAAEDGARAGFDATVALAAPLTRLFVLEADAAGAMPLLDAMAERRDFHAQPATIRTSGERVTLAGTVRVDAAGGFAGFVGGTFAAAPPAEEDAPTREQGMTAAFHARLDRMLRGPLGRIVANADSINAGSDGPLDPHYTDYAADIASAGRHLIGLVDDLVDLEAIERDDFVTEREAIDLADLMRRAAGLLAVRAADNKVTIDRSECDTPLPAIGEFRRTLQILVNLIGNALRYSPRGATVWLHLQREGDRAVAIVADQGKGIAPEDQARIFEKFERVDTSEQGGSGLGLYIARRLARAMGGDLTVDSALGMGARFVLSLPAGE